MKFREGRRNGIGSLELREGCDWDFEESGVD